MAFDDLDLFDFKQVSTKLQNKEFDAALQLLWNGFACDTTEWHMLNALTLFRLRGDDVISRSALAQAFEGEAFILLALAEGEQSIWFPTLEALDKSEYYETTFPAWDEEALRWAKHACLDPFARFNRGMDPIGLHYGDKQRWKRWNDALERACMIAGDGGERAERRAFRECLREAERIEYSFGPFQATINDFLEMVETDDSDAEELRQRVDARLSRLKTVEPDVSFMRAFEYDALADILQTLDDDAGALTLFESAVAMLEKVPLADTPSVTLVDLCSARHNLAFSLIMNNRFEDARTLIQGVLETQETFIGPNHDLLTIGLSLLCDCLRGMDANAELEKTLSRIMAIEGTGDDDDDDDVSADVELAAH